MSKKYKGKFCVYCAKELAATGDHIFARGFFLESVRADLPKAPACKRCNAEKSDLEHYLQPVFAFGGRHQDAFKNLDISARRKLAKDAKLYRQLAVGYTETSVPLDCDKVEALFRLIAKGLIWHYWKVYMDDRTHSVNAAVVTAAGAHVIDELISQAKQVRRVSENLGNGTFIYEGAQAHDDLRTSVWKFSIYGGLEVVEGASTSSVIIVYTKPRSGDSCSENLATTSAVLRTG
jgi:hypothetical protein